MSQIPLENRMAITCKFFIMLFSDIKSFGELLTVDLEEMNNHEVNDQSEATILEVQEGCLAVLYCAWLHDDKYACFSFATVYSIFFLFIFSESM